MGDYIWGWGFLGRSSELCLPGPVAQFTGTRIQEQSDRTWTPWEEWLIPFPSHFQFPMAFSVVGLGGGELVVGRTWGPGYFPELLCDLRQSHCPLWVSVCWKEGAHSLRLPIIETLWEADEIKPLKGTLCSFVFHLYLVTYFHSPVTQSLQICI